jgi:hypothetical protein
MKTHKSVTVARLQALYEADEDTLGVCIECGEEQDGVEPDAERYVCQSCKRPGVFGVQQLFLLLTGW